MNACNTHSARGRWIIVATTLASGMAFLDGTVVTVALPVMQQYFSANLMTLQWIVDAYVLTLASLLITAGSMGDIFGKRKIFTAGIIMFVLCSLVCGIAQSSAQLIIARALQGVGAALMIPGSLAIINACFVEENRGRAIGLWAGLSGGIATMGPFVGGWLTETLSWRYIFLINLPIGLIALIITLRSVPVLPGNKSQKIDWLGTLFVVLTLSALSFGLIEGPYFGWNSAIICSSFLISVCSLIAFIFTEKHSKHPMIAYGLFTDHNVVYANIMTFLIYFALNGLIFLMVLNLQQLQHYTTIQAGLALIPPMILITFLSAVGGIITDKIGPKWPLTLGATLVAISMTLLLLPTIKINYWQILPGLILFGLGMSLVIAPITKTAISVTENLSGTASGVNNAIARIAALLAIAILGALAVSIFQHSLISHLQQTVTTPEQQQLIISQAQRMGGIIIPPELPQETQQIFQINIDNAFVLSYRWALGLCASLCALAALLALFLKSSDHQI